ncbi:MAG TPA: hypothetical protein VGB45_11660 [Abditibacterium sp.]|jgi:hypothetical protein
MSSFTLTLSPAELFFLPAGTPATAPAQRLQITPKEGEPFHVLARLVQILPLEKNDAWLYYRDERRPSDEIIGGGHVCLGCSTCDGKHSTPEGIAKQIAGQRRILRYWMPPSGEFAIQLQDDRPIVMATKPHDRNVQIPISNAPERDVKSSLLHWDHFQVEQFCLDLCKRDNSPLNQFLRWQSLSDTEQKAAVSTLQYGDWEQMIQMLKLVLNLHLHAFGLSGAMFYVTNPGRQKPKTPADKYLLRWRDTLLQVFSPAFLKENPPYVRQLRQQLGLQQEIFSNLMPTHHEVLEAQMQLREFLAPHLSKSEIEALFRTDNL